MAFLNKSQRQLHRHVNLTALSQGHLLCINPSPTFKCLASIGKLLKCMLADFSPWKVKIYACYNSTAIAVILFIRVALCLVVSLPNGIGQKRGVICEPRQVQHEREGALGAQQLESCFLAGGNGVVQLQLSIRQTHPHGKVVLGRKPLLHLSLCAAQHVRGYVLS